MVVGTCALLIWFCPGGKAQTTRAADDRPLSARQRAVRERLDRLESTMSRLRQILAETEPENAEKLRGALDNAAKQRLRARLTELVALLEAAQYSDAEQRQGKVLSDLEATLRILTETLSDLEKKRQERQRLEAARRAIKVLIEEQTEQLARTKEAIADREQAAALRSVADELEKLAQGQAEIAKALEQTPAADAVKTAERQSSAERETRAAAEKARKLGESPADAAPSDAQKAAKAAADEAEQAADDMKSAAEGMNSPAVEKTGEKPAQKAGEQAKSAQEKLKRAAQRLRDEAEKLDKIEAAREAEKRQRATEQKAGGLEDEMRKNDGDKRSLPGADGVQRARQNMQRAADRLGENAPNEAEAPQSQSIDELQQSLDELEDALRQMRREETEETLAALEVRLRSLLSREESVRATVVDLDLKGPSNWARVEQLALADAVAAHDQAVEDCAAIQRILLEEGTTVIFPEIVGQMLETMRGAADALHRSDTSKPVHAQLADVIETIKELLSLVEKRRDQQQSSGGNQPGEQQEGDQNQQPLLPPSAELKILRARQVQINRETDGLSAASDIPGIGRAARFEKLSAQQRRLAELARKLNEKE